MSPKNENTVEYNILSKSLCSSVITRSISREAKHDDYCRLSQPIVQGLIPTIFWRYMFIYITARSAKQAPMSVPTEAATGKTLSPAD